ncbi:hypothetical protein Taro_055866 [Colocasia esculenta]|uniref:Uncharacterized protein n=1 Tax=Colocasia esculenta TaxID=4460 RepID=A0A843XVK4_COLES|nr:hypothetical protein [Colocasia esculenta]
MAKKLTNTFMHRRPFTNRDPSPMRVRCQRMLLVYRRGEAAFMTALCRRAIIDSRVVRMRRGLD